MQEEPAYTCPMCGAQDTTHQNSCPKFGGFIDPGTFDPKKRSPVDWQVDISELKRRSGHYESGCKSADREIYREHLERVKKDAELALADYPDETWSSEQVAWADESLAAIGKKGGSSVG